jgi:hypothetical protein
MGIVFAIFMGFFGLSGAYTSLIGVYNYGDDPTYFFMSGLISLSIVITALFLSVKLYYHR